MDAYETLRKWIASSKQIVVFTGAGISVPSGIPDFRSADGLYRQNEQIHPEKIISHSFFKNHPDLFFEFYGQKMVYPDALPNAAHRYFASLTNVKAIVTQNIDGLHQKAGSPCVYELHGSVHRNYCMQCHRFYDLSEIDPCQINYCSCGGIIKPDVVLYEEPLNEEVVFQAIHAISHADLLIIVGTSLVVYPAAMYLQYFKGKHVVLINKDKTHYDSKADLVFNEDVVDVIEKIQ